MAASILRSRPVHRIYSRNTYCFPAISGGAASSFRRGIRWQRVVAPTLEQLAAHPLVTYVFSFSGPSSLYETFARVGLSPTIALTARDSDVIKTYVRLGLGVGVIADIALEPKDAADLVSIDAAHLFPSHTTWAGFARDGLLRQYMYDFLQLLAPHLTHRLIDRAAACETQQEREALFAHQQLPYR